MLPTLDIDLLKTFLAIADTGSFTRAADEVNKTQSAVSMQMKRLEDLIGRPIFVRDGRQSRFTHDGERLVEHARRLVAMNDETMALFTKPDLTGTIRLGTPDDYADRFLPEILARFARTHPLVQVDVDCLNSSALKERIRSGELDLAMVTGSCDVEPDVVVREEPLVWVASMRHSVHLSDPVPVALSQHGCSWRDKALGSLSASGRKYRVAYASTNSNAVAAAVLAGLAVGAVPEICLKHGMRVLTENDGFPSLGSFEIGILKKAGRPNQAVDALARHIADSLESYARPMMAAE